jgi:cation:H+ antiporter
MLLDLGILLIGLVVLYFGADWLIRAASSIAISMGLRPLVVGLTIVALGTSLPEFMTNILAALRRADGLALGNILGSNIANIGLILGITALLMPLIVAPSTLRREFPIMMGVQLVFWAMAIDGIISRIDGIVLLLILTAFMAYLVRDARRGGGVHDVDLAPPGFTIPGWQKTLLMLGGMAGLALGAHLMVHAAVNMARAFGIDPVIIGLTIIAIGTSLPELAAAIVGVMRKEADLSVGNVIGSNLLNVLFVVGLVAVLSPLRVDADVIAIHFPVMIAFCLLLATAWPWQQLSRWHGAFLLVTFLGYMMYVVVPVL